MNKKIVVIICSLVLFFCIIGLVYKTIRHIRHYEKIITTTSEAVTRIDNLMKYVEINTNKDFGSIRTISVNEDVYVDSDTLVAVVSLEQKNSMLVLGREPDNTTLKVANEAFIDFSNGKMGFYKCALPQSDYREVYVATNIDFEIKENHQYTIRFIKENGLHLKLIITDDFTGNSTLISAETTFAGVGWGKRKLECVKGLVNLIDFYNLSTQPYESKVLIIGDSFIEGNSLGNNKNKRYSKLIKDDLKGSVFINGQGGATASNGLLWLKSYLMGLVHPQYAIVAFGMNDRDFETWKSNTLKIIDMLEKNNIKCILVTITPSGAEVANEIHMQMNDFIRESGYMYIDAAKACSVDNDGLTFDESLFMGDKVHPTEEAHRLIYERAKRDIPDIFNNL